MNVLLQIPLPLRLATLFLLGLVLGAGVNWGIYSLAWIFPKAISPWSPPHPAAPPRRWSDYLPVVGWLGLRREAPQHGSGFWIRPLLLELCCGISLALLYQWEISGGLLPANARLVAPQFAFTLHAQFLSHVLLGALMLVATFIDFDEQTIPDTITIPGTLLGLLLAIFLPSSHLPEVFAGPPRVVSGLVLTSPTPWPLSLEGSQAMILGAALFAAWCAALIPATATLRRGYWNATRFYFASIRRDGVWPWYAGLATVGAIAIGTVWGANIGDSWKSLLTSLVGMAFGGGLVWAVRIVGRISLQREAMGFGDVTLMAMIGAFLGWQAALIVFFLSPAAALLVSIAQWVLSGRRDIAFGPYLCLAAMFLIVAWDLVWNGMVADIFILGWIIPALVGACLMLMLGLLMFWRIAEELLTGGGKAGSQEDHR